MITEYDCMPEELDELITFDDAEDQRYRDYAHVEDKSDAEAQRDWCDNGLTYCRTKTDRAVWRSKCGLATAEDKKLLERLEKDKARAAHRRIAARIEKGRL